MSRSPICRVGSILSEIGVMSGYSVLSARIKAVRNVKNKSTIIPRMMRVLKGSFLQISLIFVGSPSIPELSGRSLQRIKVSSNL